MQPKKIVYRTILLRNGEYLKTMHRCLTRETAFKRFHQFKFENKVIFPKKFINDKEIKPVEYKICVIKDVESDDDFRTIRDNMGKTSVEEPMGGIWTILDEKPYNIEETFWIYGYNPSTDRKSIKDVIKLVGKNSYSDKKSKQVVVVYNKLLIHNEEQFDMIICKCKEDAQRLHHTLARAAKRNKMKSILFMGTAKESTMSQYYDIIEENTDWPRTKIRRRSTKP
jgi:hypothetical protein